MVTIRPKGKTIPRISGIMSRDPFTIGSSAVYNDSMSSRAMQEAAFLILTALAAGARLAVEAARLAASAAAALARLRLAGGIG
jgi:hypothetical protein